MEKGEVLCPVCGARNGDDEVWHFSCAVKAASERDALRTRCEALTEALQNSIMLLARDGEWMEALKILQAALASPTETPGDVSADYYRGGRDMLKACADWLRDEYGKDSGDDEGGDLWANRLLYGFGPAIDPDASPPKGAAPSEPPPHPETYQEAMIAAGWSLFHWNPDTWEHSNPSVGTIRDTTIQRAWADGWRPCKDGDWQHSIHAGVYRPAELTQRYSTPDGSSTEEAET